MLFVNDMVMVMATFSCPFCEKQRDFDLIVQSNKYREYRCSVCYKIFEKEGKGKLYSIKNNSKLKLWDGKFEECLRCQNRPKIATDYLPAVCEQCRKLNPTNFVALKEQKKK